ncbi:MFS-type transporter SLC18B1 [Galendromus occidentalis]|uniref:MFS-type transporter SLC18B1 n=1 Tax=Galendromus occidentalis TaxID=34638 RepID=A0AAJ7PB40_9ACAR|nr:MFS-type transporter SLC18B1 [Galendromus occidentalis]
MEVTDPGVRRMALTRRQWKVMLIATLGVLANTTTYGVLAPFYPEEARLKDNSQFEVGLVFATYAVCGFFSSPIVGSLLSIGFSSKIILVSGLFVGGSFFAVMGWLHAVPSGTPFFLANFFCRIVQSLGASLCSTCFYSIISAELPDHKNIAIATLETMFGLGMMLGPAFGGFLHELGGYPLPCYVFGAIGCFVGMIAWVFLPPTELKENQSTKINFHSLDAQLFTDLLATVCALSIMNYNDVTLSGELKRYEMTGGKLGLVFLICATVYGVSSMMWGTGVQIVGDPRYLVIVGALITSVGTFLMRPVQMLGVEITLPLQIGAQCLIGLGMSAMYVCSTLHGMHYAVHRLGFPDDISTHGFISGVFMAAMFCGCFIGPVAGGLIDDMVGYARTLQITTVYILLTASLVMLTMITDKIQSRGDEEESLRRKGEYVVIGSNAPSSLTV